MVWWARQNMWNSRNASSTPQRKPSRDFQRPSNSASLEIRGLRWNPSSSRKRKIDPCGNPGSKYPGKRHQRCNGNLPRYHQLQEAYASVWLKCVLGALRLLQSYAATRVAAIKLAAISRVRLLESVICGSLE